MSDQTTNLQLPYIQASQAQKHVPANATFDILDSLVQLAVESRTLTAPPGSPVDGTAYIPGSGATGAWASWDLNIAVYRSGVWSKIVPRDGWTAWVKDERLGVKYQDSVWRDGVALTAHGGRITAHSEGVGRGSEFVVWLPLGEESATSGASRTASEGVSGLASASAGELATVSEFRTVSAGLAAESRSGSRSSERAESCSG